MAGRKYLLEQRAKLNFRPRSSGLHVGEHALQVADSGRKALHLAEPPLHRFKPVAHELERFAETLLKRYVQLLVDGLAHLVELLLVAFLQFLDARIDGEPDAVQGLRVGVTQLLELHVHAVELGSLHVSQCAEVGRERLVGRLQGSRQLLSRFSCRARGLFASVAELLSEIRLASAAGGGPHDKHGE